MIPCARLLNVERHAAAVCAELDLPVPTAVRSSDYDRIEFDLTGWTVENADRLRRALIESLRDDSLWDAWVINDRTATTLCVAEPEHPEDSE